MWKRHWRLRRDPFLDRGAPYIPTAPHEEAIARLVHAIESAERRSVLRAAAGSGKSLVLTQALAATRSPSRRIALVSSPADGPAMLIGLAEGLGIRLAPETGRSAAWRRLADAVRLCRWQRLQVVAAIDDAQDLITPTDRLDLERLIHLDPHPEARLTVVLTYRTPDDLGADESRGWDLEVRLPALTRGDAERYVVAKLAAAGRVEPTFTPRALTRLHAISGGLPRGIDRIASLSLMGGAARGLEMITPDVVEAVAPECAASAHVVVGRGAWPAPA